MPPTRDQAWELLNEYTKNPNLIKHALAVEAAMRGYARKYGEDEEKWALVGLLHDFDYDRWPDPADHPLVGSKILGDKGYPEDIIYAIKTHAEYLNLPRKSRMDKALFAVDELCGFLTAVTLVRPDRKISSVPVKSVKKKLKDKAFAKSVSRDDIRRGTADLGEELGEHIQFVIDALAEVAQDLGLDGSLARG